MKFFQNRAVAVVIAVVGVALSTLLSAKIGMTRDYDRLHNSFFRTDGKTPVYYVDQQISAAASLATVGERYDTLTNASALVREARKALVGAEEAMDISDISDASAVLSAAVDSLRSAAAGVEMTSADASVFADGTAMVAGARRELLEGDYNEEATKLIQKNYESFPASFFAGLLNIPRPELFTEGTL